MTQISLHATDKSPVAVAKKDTTSRLFYIDHLRVALMILVVLHHVALVYGASLEGYYYVEPPFTSPFAFKALLVFALVNQAWFMATFFRNVWTGRDLPPLGLIDTVNTLDSDDLAVIIGWMRDPFFP